MDTFGDGFDTGALYIYDSKHFYKKYASDCNQNPLIFEYCFDSSTSNIGDSVTITMTGFEPKHQWEVWYLIQL
jgi:hypothetical protein